MQEHTRLYKMDYKNEDQETSTGGKFVYIAVFTCNIISLSTGLSESWSSPTISKLISNDTEILEQNPFGRVIDSEEESWIGSILALGAVFGPIPTGFLADKIGRKNTIIAIAIPFIVSYFTLAFAQTIYLYYLARFMVGFGIGGVFTVVPMYVGEISEDSNRGMLGSSMNCFLTLGLLLSYSIGPYVPIMAHSIFCAIFPCVFVVVFFMFIPESPFYLIAKNKTEEAEKSLMKLRSKSDVALVSKELTQIKVEVEKAEGGSFTDIFKSKGLIKAMTISASLIALQQFSGINIVLFYTEKVFDATGSSIPPAIASIIIGVVQFCASFVTPALVDRLGRKILLVTSAAGMLLAETSLGLYFFLKDSTNTDVEPIFWLPVVSLVAYIIAYNVGFGPLPWALMGELFPPNVKSGASSATAMICWTLGFIIAKFFNTVADEIGMGGSFWIFAGFCAIAIVFVVTYLPETKGKSFKEIQDLLES